MSSLKIVFAGSPAPAVPSLRALLASQHHVAAVLTRTDSPQGRRGVLTPTPVADVANDADIPIIKANRLVGEATDAIVEIAPDLGVIVAYGGLVREPLLSAPRLGWINLHFSLLPRWRGAAPVQHAIIAGDDITGASVFQLVEELDAGGVYGRVTEPIGRHHTAGGLLTELATSGAQLLVRVVDAMAEGTARAEPQLGDVTLAPKLALSDAEIDFSLPADLVSARIRGVTPEPGAFAVIEGARVKVLDAHVARDTPAVPPGTLHFVAGAVIAGTATDPIQLVTVQPAGKRAMDAASWWRGRPANASAVIR